MKEKISTSIDLPVSEECKNILNRAEEESQRFNHANIGTEHLLLGMLGETNSLAAKILHTHGLDLTSIREKIALAPPPPEEGRAVNLPELGCVPDPETAMRIAEAVWIPLYGEDLVNEQKPLHADLTASVWTVTGSPGTEKALVAVISRINGRIFKIGPSVLKRNS